MALQSLLLCPDEKTARVLSRVLAELEIGMEQCTEPFDAVKKLMRQRYDAVIVDWENEANATLVLKNARMSPSNKTSLAVAIVEGQTSVRNAFRAGANFVLYKPISVEQAKTSLRAARALMQRGAEAAAKQGGDSAGGPTLVPPQDFSKSSGAAQTSRMAPVVPMPAQSSGAPGMSAADTSWNNAGVAAAPARDNQSADLLDDLRTVASTAIENLHPGSPTSSASAVTEAARSGGSVKPFPGTAGKSQEEDGFYHLDLDADPSKEGKRASTNSAATQILTPRPVMSPVKPAVVSEEFKPKLEPAAKSGISFDEVRSRVSAQAPRSAPSFTLGDQTEETAPGIPKAILLGGGVVIVVAVLIFAIMHFRSAPKQQPAAQVTPPVTQQQAAPQETPAATVVSTPLPSTTTSASQAVTAGKPEAKSAKDAAAKPSAGKTAQASEPASAELENPEPEAQPELQVHKLSAIQKSKAQTQIAEAAPPSMDAISGSVAAPVGGLMQTPVSVPQLVAPDRVRISQGVSQGMLVQMVKPRYPEAARSMRLQGAVVMDALIGKDGVVKNLKVVSGHSMLAKAAEEAVRQWRYKPYLLNGQPVSVETQITVKFMP